MFLLSTVFTVFAEEPIKIMVNGIPINLDTEPKFIGGRTLVPLRGVFENLGVDVEWDKENYSVSIKNKNTKIILPINSEYAEINGQKMQLDTPAMIIDGRAFIPVRFIAESLGEYVGWDHSNQTIIIKTYNTKKTVFFQDDSTDVSNPYKEELSKELQDAIIALKRKVIFDNDIAIFTLYAFLNFTGYDEENNSQGFHWVRKAIRHDLEKMNIALMDNNYYLNKKVDSSRYRQILARMDGAPNFRVKLPLPNYLSKLDDLGIHLKEFYEKANIENLFAKYDSIYRSEMERYSELIYPALAKINQFLRVKNDEVPEFYFQVNLLDAYWSGYGLGTIFEHKGKGILITGPSNEPNIKIFVHEYLHGIITPLNNELRQEIEELSYLMKRVPSNTTAAGPSYNNWFAVFDESMIRALDGKYSEQGDNYIQQGMRQGFILTEYFHERFKEFESFEGSLKEFIKMLIDDIKIEFK